MVTIVQMKGSQDWINVKDYGAVGDGVNDDTNAINDAINAAMNTSRVLYFPRGTYKVSSLSITLNVQPFTILGAGKRLTILTSSVDTPLTILGNNARLTIRDIGFQCPVKPALIIKKMTNANRSITHSRLDSIYISGGVNNRAALELIDIAYSTITDLMIRNSNHGMLLVNDSTTNNGNSVFNHVSVVIQNTTSTLPLQYIPDSGTPENVEPITETETTRSNQTGITLWSRVGVMNLVTFVQPEIYVSTEDWQDCIGLLLVGASSIKPVRSNILINYACELAARYAIKAVFAEDHFISSTYCQGPLLFVNSRANRITIKDYDNIVTPITERIEGSMTTIDIGNEFDIYTFKPIGNVVINQSNASTSHPFYRSRYRILTQGTPMRVYTVRLLETPSVGASPYTYQSPYLRMVLATISGGSGVSITYSKYNPITATYDTAVPVSNAVFLLPQDRLTITYVTAPTLKIWDTSV